jgi:VWFA-related protein
LLTLALPLSAAAQNFPTGETTFTSNSELVLVPVQVTDGAGQPLRGLKQQDFTVLSDNKSQKIALFEEVQGQPVRTRSGDLLRVSSEEAAGPANTFSNVPPQGLPQESLILAVDLVNSSPYLQQWTKAQIVRFLRDTPPRIPTALVAITAGGLREYQGFTTDASLLAAAVQRIATHNGPLDFNNAPALHVSFTGPGTFAASMAEI